MVGWLVGLVVGLGVGLADGVGITDVGLGEIEGDTDADGVSLAIVENVDVEVAFDCDGFIECEVVGDGLIEVFSTSAEARVMARTRSSDKNLNISGRLSDQCRE